MKDAELRVLQAQINPHFLFNTLNAIVTLIRIDPDHGRLLTVKLGQFMRMSLKMTQSPLIPLYQEMEHLNTYISIIQTRFSDQLTVECSLDSNLETVQIPPSTLQPLVENSIQHGLKQKLTGGWVRIQLKRAEHSVEITVEDNGTGIPSEYLGKLGTVPMKESSGTGLGVHNVNQRLISLLGSEASLTFVNRNEGGTKVAFAIPFDNGGNFK
ncbi:sensor histidine kinase [Cohnella kolymensis]|uniref:sensor histidine kinase n=1 Tax=Cohnella kolymensis TaxID=1590652 RepID=UPI002E131113